MAGSSSPSVIPAPEEVSFPGRIVARSGVKSQIPGAALITGELAFTTDNFWGWLGDESQAPPSWPTSKSTGDFDWTNINPRFNNINVITINNKKLSDLFTDYITSGATPVITIINEAVTKTVYGVNPDFADLDAAYAWLSQRTISIRGSVFLQFPGTKITESKYIAAKHPNGERIHWIGAALKQAAIAPTAFQITDNTPAARALDGTANLALLRLMFATEIAFINGGGLFFEGDLGDLTNILLTSDGAQGGIGNGAGLSVSNARVGLNNVGIVGFPGNGILSFNGASLFMFSGTNLYVLNTGGNGIVTFNSSLFNFVYGTTTLASNAGYGSWIRDSSLNSAYPAANVSTPTNLHILGNGSGGLFMVSSLFTFSGSASLFSRKNFNFGVGLVGARFRADGITVTQNAGTGVYIDGVSTYNSANSTIQNNTGTGILCSNGSYAFQGGSTVSGNGTNYSPAVGTVGNTGALITN